MIIKAISLWEPWATAMDLDLKLNETRSFTLGYRGPLAIHHAKKKFYAADYDPNFVMQLASDGVLSSLDYGVIRSVVEWYDSQPTHKIRQQLTNRELFYGNYEDERFAWLTRNRVKLGRPVPVRGHQGLFDWEVPPDLEHLIAPLLADRRTPERERGHSCEAILEATHKNQTQAKNGERWTCTCGLTYVHVCDEAEGCWWQVVPPAKEAAR